MKNEKNAIAQKLEAASELDAYSDGDVTEWSLIDSATKFTIAVIVPVDGEGEAYAQALCDAYNRSRIEASESAKRG